MKAEVSAPTGSVWRVLSLEAARQLARLRKVAQEPSVQSGRDVNGVDRGLLTVEYSPPPAHQVNRPTPIDAVATR